MYRKKNLLSKFIAFHFYCSNIFVGTICKGFKYKMSVLQVISNPHKTVPASFISSDKLFKTMIQFQRWIFPKSRKDT